MQAIGTEVDYRTQLINFKGTENVLNYVFKQNEIMSSNRNRLRPENKGIFRLKQYKSNKY